MEQNQATVGLGMTGIGPTLRQRRNRCAAFRKSMECDIARLHKAGVPAQDIWAAVDSALDYASLLLKEGHHGE
jgi:hypothetical protein